MERSRGSQRVICMGSGKDREFEAVYRRQYPPLVAELTLVTRSRVVAEDCAQEAFARLLSRWPKVSRHDRPGAWVRRVAHNLAVDEHRRRRRHADLVDGPSIPDGPEIELVQIIADLPLQQRQVLVLHALFDSSDAEIGDVLGVPVGTVKSRLSRARAAIKHSWDATEQAPKESSS